MKAVFNKEKAQVGAFSGIVKTSFPASLSTTTTTPLPDQDPGSRNFPDGIATAPATLQH